MYIEILAHQEVSLPSEFLHEILAVFVVMQS